MLTFFMERIQSPRWRILLALLATACGQGEFHNSIDPLFQRYGVEGLSLSQGSSLVGLVLPPQGSSAAGFEVQLRPLSNTGVILPLMAYTNSKGGFYLKSLAPGEYRLLVLSRDGLGHQEVLTIDAGQMLKRPDIKVQPMPRLSGRVQLKSEVDHSGAMVSLEGTPFVTLTSKEGFFSLQAPVGAYPLRIRRDNYIPLEIPDFALHEDLAQDFELSLMPWPDGVVRLTNAPDGIVRGLRSQFRLTWVDSVKYMRIIPARPDRIQGSTFPMDAWREVTSEFAIDFKKPGTNKLEIMFQDAWGKNSKPITLESFNTTFDSSWRLIHGQVREPLVIKAGEKVAFLAIEGNSTVISRRGSSSSHSIPHAGSAGGTTAGNAPRILEETTEKTQTPIEGSAGQSSDDATQPALFLPEILGPVRVEEGAILSGSGEFNGPITLMGTATKPIRWDLMGEYGYSGFTYLNDHTDIAHAILSQGNLISQGGGNRQSISLRQSRLESVNMVTYADTSSGEVTWAFDSTTWNSSALAMRCFQNSQPDSPEAPGTENQMSSKHSLSIKNSILMESLLEIQCTKSTSVDVVVQLHRNNILAPRKDGFSFYWNSYGIPEGSPLPPFPDNSKIGWDAADNYFAEPQRLYEGVLENGWPETELGINRTAPHDDVGAP